MGSLGPDRLVRPEANNIQKSDDAINRKTGEVTYEGECVDNALIEEKSGYSCAQIKEFVNNDCSRLLIDIAGNSDMMKDVSKDTTLADACPRTCGVCTDNDLKNYDDCVDNPVISQFTNFTCAEIVNSVGCDTYVKDIYDKPLPDSVPKETRVKDVCIKTCNACPRSVDTSTKNECYDDPRVSRMGYTCSLFLQFGKEGCRTKLKDLLGISNKGGESEDDYSNIFPEGISESMSVKDVCRLSCGVCTRKEVAVVNDQKKINVNKKKDCYDNPLVNSMGYSCSLLINYGASGCNSYLRDLSSEALPSDVPENAKVKDVCMDSCGLCNEGISMCIYTMCIYIYITIMSLYTYVIPANSSL